MVMMRGVCLLLGFMDIVKQNSSARATENKGRW